MSRLDFQCRHRYRSGFELDAAFQAGDRVTALFGPSGSGKTTVLALIAGLMRPAQGRIRLGERTLFQASGRTFVPPNKRQVGVVFQEHLLFPHLTVRSNLRYGLRRRPAPRIDFDRVVEILELGDLLWRYPHTLSGGQRQRTALGRALLSGPELLLMDEPLTALDQGLKERILTYLERALAEYQIPTLLVSHDQADVRRLADRVVVLEAGRVVESGPVDAVLDRALISRMPSQPAPINVLRVERVKQVEGHWEGQLGGQRLRLAGEVSGTTAPIHVRLLPHDVTLSRGPAGGLSVRNQLHGRVVQVVMLQGRALVAIDVGQNLWAEVTPEAVCELGLEAGSEVVCLIKASAVEPLA